MTERDELGKLDALAQLEELSGLSVLTWLGQADERVPCLEELDERECPCAPDELDGSGEPLEEPCVPEE